MKYFPLIASAPKDVQDELRWMRTQLYSLLDRSTSGKTGLSDADLEKIRKALQVGGSHPLNVIQLLGGSTNVNPTPPPTPTSVKYTTSWTAQTTVTVTHNLGTTAVLVQVFDSTNALVLPESTVITNANIVTLTFGAAFTGSVVVFG